ncbi:uncharacterized protein TRIREDRAFT_124277 [Trichoderma reesei QM6a]|uniref:Predicted protein n=2 Tax=Hypocrea jecorina TaxID=51453 RepID=G0RXH9_HYPJQ|nr:uncharacterized protein TRIREDRAFT_124277 [Trichoderma reesei QM6a]EGR44109.1 predicted protein [Trichoderma reesei QM6a]ETR97343.1 hypothetical protein M419DRAFT_26839 [Trichoderma reesei RUT C-30]
MRSALLITAFVASSAMADFTTSSTVGDSDSAAAAAITPEECAAKCSEAHDACATKPEANMAECASEFASCLGYNPFVNGDLVQPTACSPQAPSSSSPSSSASAGAPWHTKSPSSSSSSSSHHHHEEEEDGEKDECKCYDEYNRCRAAPGANLSFCASNYAECLGYNPFDGSHDPEEVSSKCASSSKGGEGEKGEGHRPHHNETRPVQPTQPPVISGAASGVKALDVFGLLAAGIAALL